MDVGSFYVFLDSSVTTMNLNLQCPCELQEKDLNKKNLQGVVVFLSKIES